MPWPTPMHMVASAQRPPLSASPAPPCRRCGRRDMPSGWPSAMAPPLALTCGGVVGDAELAQHGERLAGEGLVEFDHVEIAGRQAEPGAELLRRRRRADAHDARRHAGRGAAEDAGDRASGRVAAPPPPRR